MAEAAEDTYETKRARLLARAIFLHDQHGCPSCKQDKNKYIMTCKLLQKMIFQAGREQANAADTHPH